MCGIAGYIGDCGRSEMEQALLKMGRVMRHRGPDGYGTWVSPESPVGFVHQRLSIIDLSELGRQPMVSSSGQYQVTFNGEIYNYREIRKELTGAGFSFRGGSDTEVLLAAIERWGIKAAAQRFIGMFAFAIWDKASKKLSLVRDRVGIKPLYYYQQGKQIAFSSELNSLSVSPYNIKEINKQSLSLYMKYRYIPAPHSIFKNVFKIMPGTVNSFDLDGGPPVVESFWSLTDIAEKGQEDPLLLDPSGYVEKLEAVLEDSIRMRMIADVPLGAFLSGGIDSSTIVALMQKQSARPIKTYTIGFTDKKYNEAERAAAIAKHLGTEHHELYLKPNDMLGVVDHLPSILGEPMADVSILPTLMVSELAAKDVTVVLSGDGGDELFCGYNSYTRALKWKSDLDKYPRILKNFAGKSLGTFYRGGGKLARFSSLLKASNHEEISQVLASLWQDTSGILRGSNYIERSELKTGSEVINADVRHYMMLKDAGCYMVDDILMKVDRASMAHSLEARVPIIDHRVLELAWRMPLEVKIKENEAKWPLKQILQRYVPKELYEGPKQGFDVPISSWLRGELKSWAGDLIFSGSLKNNEFICDSAVIKLWNEHQSGKYDRGAYLWSILSFLNWQRNL